MPPRISLPVRLRVPNGSRAPSSTAASALRAFSTTPANNVESAAQRRKRHDPYAQAQADARKAANLSRQAALKEERRAALGDPVRGITTPFVQSFDTGLPQPRKTTYADISKTTTSGPTEVPEGPEATSEKYLNHFLSRQEVKDSLANSEQLAMPSAPSEPELSEEAQDQRNIYHRPTKPIAQQIENAAAAIQRIVSLANGSSGDRTRVNIQRCIDTFGRHETDKVLPPQGHGSNDETWAGTGSGCGGDEQADGTAPLNPEMYKRAGPDTGSSEVQIAILTAKIRTLANFLETRGTGDKVNKRNLRLLVHRRQKLLRYLRKRERGGPRWQHLIETLGLVEGTWKGEISL